MGEGREGKKEGSRERYRRRKRGREEGKREKERDTVQVHMSFCGVCIQCVCIQWKSEEQSQVLSLEYCPPFKFISSSRQRFGLAWNSPIGLAWLPRESPESTHFHLPRARIRSM